MVFESLLLGFLVLNATSPPHDFYISICYIKEVGDELEVNYRIFKNDAELALAESEENTTFCSDIAAYINSHFKILEDEQPVSLNFKDCKKEGSGTLETIACTFVSNNHRTETHQMKIHSTVLLDTYEDQVNMIHVQIGDTKKSMNLDIDRKFFALDMSSQK